MIAADLESNTQDPELLFMEVLQEGEFVQTDGVLVHEFVNVFLESDSVNRAPVVLLS